MQPVIRIPDTLVNWPWPRTVNPHYERCKAESTAWLEGFKAFSPRAQKAFNRCDFSKWLYAEERKKKGSSSAAEVDMSCLGLLSALAYPRLDQGGFCERNTDTLGRASMWF